MQLGLQPQCVGSQQWTRSRGSFAKLLAQHVRRRELHLRVCAIAFPGSRGQRQPKEPLESRILSSLLNIGAVPYSSYVPEPVTVLHRINPVIKQLWLMTLLVIIARATPLVRSLVAAGIAMITIAALPRRLWQPQLRRLAYIALFVFLVTATGADGIPPVLQPRAPAAALEGLGALQPAQGGYRYVLLHLWIVTVTQRSVKLAITAAAVTFIALQSASLCLTTTAPEQLALAIRTLLSPLRLLAVPVDEITLTLLLSLRFMSLAFEESRNLCLGLAARAVDWGTLGRGASLSITLTIAGRLFSNLLRRSEAIATAMTARGFVGPQQQQLYIMDSRAPSLVADIAAVALLAATMWAVMAVA